MKIADFGLARAKKNREVMAIGVGTPPYMVNMYIGGVENAPLSLKKK
jgi:hypothetical protein